MSKNLNNIAKFMLFLVLTVIISEMTKKNLQVRKEQKA